MDFIKKIIVLAMLWLPMGMPKAATCDEMQIILDEYGQAYEQLKPSAGSSVNADYKLSQTALGGFYTTKSLALIYRQNMKIVAQNENMIKKTEKMIEQNNEIIRLLTIIAKEKNQHKLDE